MSGISMNVPAGRDAFSRIEQSFSMDRGGGDSHIRFQDGKGLYNSDKASMASVKAFFGFPAQLQARMDKREAGVDRIKDAINQEFGPGMGDRVLQHLNDTRGIDLSGGIRRSDLGSIREAAGELREIDRTIKGLKYAIDGGYGAGMGDRVMERLKDQGTDLAKGITEADFPRIDAAIEQLELVDKRDAALGDPDNGLNRGEISEERMVSYMTRHFDACSSPAFWSHQNARMNADNFGCSLCLSVLDRIAAKGHADPRDLADLQRVLGPFESSTTPPPPHVGDHLLGDVTPAKFDEMSQMVFDRYMSSTGHWMINMEGRPHQEQIYAEFPTASGQERLELMHMALTETLGGQYMGSENIEAPLREIV